jgi:hypothetical protein
MNCSRILHRYLLPLTLATLIGMGSQARAQGNPAAAKQGAASDANGEVVKLIKAGMPESVVVAKIRSTTGTFDASADALIHLKAAGATEAELKAMLAKSGCRGRRVGRDSCRQSRREPGAQIRSQRRSTSTSQCSKKRI